MRRWIARRERREQPGALLYAALAALVLLAFLTAISALPSRAQPAPPAARVLLEPSGDSELDRALESDLNREVLALALVPAAGELFPAISTELDRLSALVRAFGYLDGAVEAEFEAAEAGEPPFLRLTPRPGQPYRLGSIQVAGLYQEGGEELADALHGRISRSVGEVARAETVSAVISDVLSDIRSASFPFARLADARLVPDAATLTATLQLVVTPGANATLGPVTFSGMQAVSAADLEALVPFRRGDPYAPERIEELRRALAGVPLIRSVRIETSDLPTAGGEVAVTASIREYADPRLLERFKPLGITLLILTLLLLVAREAMALSAAPARLQQGLAVATWLGIGLSAVLVAERAASFLDFA